MTRFLFLLLIIFPLNYVNSDEIPFYLELLSTRTKDCFLKFFEAVVVKEFSCSGRYEFLAIDNVKKREAFLEGKKCFFEIIESKCHPDRSDVFYAYYNDLVDTLTFIPAHSGCSETYYRLNAQRCYAQKNVMELEIEKQLERLPRYKNDTENCMDGLCFTEDDHYEIEFSLAVPELTVSHFTVCIQTIDKEIPDLSKYNCLENRSFYRKIPEFLCKRYQKKKRECLRAVTRDYCGRDVVKPVEEYLDDFIELKCQDFIEN